MGGRSRGAVNFNQPFSSHGLRKRTQGQVHTGTTDHSPDGEVVAAEHFLEDVLEEEALALGLEE